MALGGDKPEFSAGGLAKNLEFVLGESNLLNCYMVEKAVQDGALA